MMYRVTATAFGWTVRNGAGEQVSPVFTRKAQAEDVALRLAARRADRRRPCMCCGQVFESEGAHHRLCSRCRTAVNDTGIAPTLSTLGRSNRSSAQRMPR